VGQEGPVALWQGRRRRRRGRRVILHEYGHAIQDSQQTPFGSGASTEAGSIGEGFADYWAVTVSDVIAPTPDEPCVADWDAVSYATTVPHCPRRVDTSLHHPEEDTLILQAQFDMPDPTIPQLAQRTVDTAQSLYGISTAKKVKDAFVARGIL